MQNRLINELKTNLEFLSGAERKIADIILAQPNRVISSSLSELSEAAGVSQGSIINFSNKFAGGGFPILKYQIVAFLSGNEDWPFSVVQKDDGVKEIFHKTADNVLSAFQNTAAVNDEKTLERVANKILHARKVDLYGVYRSALVANDFYYELLTLGIPASFVGDVLTCSVSASMLERDCLVIAVSASGKTKDVIDAVKIAQRRGVPVVCITSNKNSPLAKMSDDVLIAAASGNSLSGNAGEIRLSQLALTDALCSYLRSKIDEDGEHCYFGLREILNSHDVND